MDLVKAVIIKLFCLLKKVLCFFMVFNFSRKDSKHFLLK